ncbi:MAG: DNA primase [Lachnospiraceae bacterium]|nr:DNA primase [Lachnospiraceae bacterium]
MIEEVRSRSDIVDVIGSYVRLRRTGSTYMGLCPFHSENTPSFNVNPSHQLYKCFGCGVGGNVFTFIMEYEHYSFTEAVKFLADRNGIAISGGEMSEEQKKRESIRAAIIEINTKAAKFYYALLKSEHGKYGYDYLKSRGLSEETIRHFGLGFAGSGGVELYGYLKKEGYSDTLLKETGLFKMDERGAYDKFLNRVMFPIMDISNHVIGFGGRVMGDAKPKYLNSPETKVFDKGRNLYGLNYAKKGRKKAFILCEGYMDVIAMHQAGFTNAVASLGTAFTEYQANIIKRYVEEVLLIYDSDEAGRKAALRAIPILRRAGLSGKVVSLNPHKDPDEFIKAEGTEAFEERLSSAVNSFFFEITVLKDAFNLSDPAQKTKFIHETAKKLLVFRDKVERDSYLEAIAAEHGIPKEDLKNLVIRYGNSYTENYEEPLERRTERKKKEEKGITYSYQLFLSELIANPNIFAQVKEAVSPKDFFVEVYREVAGLLYQQLEEGELIPAKIVGQFEEADTQKIVADMFQTDYEMDMSLEEREKAFIELIYKIKEYSIENRMRGLTDLNELQKLVKEKKKWQNPGNLHISLKDG